MRLAVIFLVIVLVVVAAYISMSNSIKILALKVDEAASGIDVALTKRYDVLTKLLDIVKEYQSYERDVILKAISLRKGMSINEKAEAEGKMNAAFDQLRLVAENYPELKANQNFMELQRAVVDTEEHLQAARRAYNANVTAYNTRIVAFPSSVVASIGGYTQKVFYEADESKRADVEMKF